ncbi:MAG: ATP-binding protein, partial [Fusobacteriaceae bacterium]
KKIEQHLERVELAEGSGLWNVGTYFLSEDPQNSVVAANIYNGIIRGKISGIERNTVCTFNQSQDLEELKDYLYNFTNPILKIKMQDSEIFTSVGSLVTNDELALKLNLPQKSVAGLDVIKMAAFGRNKQAIANEKSFEIGNLYHLGKTSSTKVELDIESLTSHTFITGSTGSGKSNAIYCMLEELRKNKIKFLVIEPAKGEYKNVFGGKDDVSVYGTNIKYTDLLKVNPFSFNDEIHILEHIDRLTEIFNACWPMYAAMPALLKDAIEKSYVMLGWDLKESKNLYGNRKFPTLKQLKAALTETINESSYSEETKSNYTGALVTRVNSLQNGLIGNIFCEDELSERKLFNENVIIDISRIPSTETKSLIMGIVFMKLHEYRMSNNTEENSSLKHVTVLEEAHNLLKRTSTEQSMEGSNLQGKSVEMMSNAIAEMRTYGEGFIIADQAPGLLDLSVIRNTNTKICLRLPSLEDREILGRSMNLNDVQIEELAKIEVGVAAVIQSNWNESCLVKFKYMLSKDKYIHNLEKKEEENFKNILKFLLENKLPEVEKLKEKEKKENLDLIKSKKINLENMTAKELDSFIFKSLEGDKILNIVNAIKSKDVLEWSEKIQNILTNILDLNEKDVFFRKEIANSIVRENTLRNPEYLEFYKEFSSILKEGKSI